MRDRIEDAGINPYRYGYLTLNKGAKNTLEKKIASLTTGIVHIYAGKTVLYMHMYKTETKS